MGCAGWGVEGGWQPSKPTHLQFWTTHHTTLEWFQMKRHGFKSISNSDKRLAHTVRRNLAYILFKNILDKVMRKAKNCKIPVTKRPNYIIKSNLKFGFIFLKSSTLVSNYIAKLSTKVNPYYESIENFGITLIKHHLIC